MFPCRNDEWAFKSDFRERPLLAQSGRSLLKEHLGWRGVRNVQNLISRVRIPSDWPLRGSERGAGPVPSRSIERVSDAVGAKRGYVLLRFSATLKVRRERPNASQVRGVNLTGLFQDQSDYRPQVLLCSPARRHGNFYWKLKS